METELQVTESSQNIRNDEVEVPDDIPLNNEEAENHHLETVENGNADHEQTVQCYEDIDYTNIVTTQRI